MKVLNSKVLAWPMIFIWTLFICGPAGANECSRAINDYSNEKLISELFKRARGNQSIYEPGRCHINVY